MFSLKKQTLITLCQESWSNYCYCNRPDTPCALSNWQFVPEIITKLATVQMLGIWLCLNSQINWKIHIVNHLVASLIQDNEIRSLRDLEYRVISKSDTRNLKINDSEQLWKILVDELGIQVTEDESRQLYEKRRLRGRRGAT